MKIVYLIFTMLMSNLVIAQNQIIPLWPGEIPNYIDAGEKEEVAVEGITRIAKVQTPHVEVFLPSKSNSNGKAIVIFPGGGYSILAYDWEGTDIAKWLNSKGIAAFVVKNRLPDDASSKVGYLSPFLDARRAIQLVRFHAKDFNVDENKIGVMGFSAGGHLAATLSTHYDENIPSIKDSIAQVNARPDFSILVYPVITMKMEYTYEGSRQALLGENPDEKLVAHYSNETQVTSDTPPTILIHASDDSAVPVQNSLQYYEALIKKGVSAEMHIYPSGGHGFSLAIGNAHLRSWTDRVVDWIDHLKL